MCELSPPEFESFKLLWKRSTIILDEGSQLGVILGCLAVSGNTDGYHRGGEERYWSLAGKGQGSCKTSNNVHKSNPPRHKSQ